MVWSPSNPWAKDAARGLCLGFGWLVEEAMTHQIFVLSFEEQGARIGVKAIGAFKVWLNPNVPVDEILLQLHAAIRALEAGDKLTPREANLYGSNFPDK
jgi:hypothetical protein